MLTLYNGSLKSVIKKVIWNSVNSIIQKSQIRDNISKQIRNAGIILSRIKIRTEFVLELLSKLTIANQQL